MAAGKEMDVEALARHLAALPVDGITFSGGEPMQQAYNLLRLIKRITFLNPQLTIGMYTGYTPKELKAGQYDILGNWQRWSNGPEEVEKQILWRDMTGYLDFAVMGRYQQNRPSDKPLCASANQELVLFSYRYTLDDFQPQATEVFLAEDGLVQITGFPPNNLVAELAQ
jgi:anaerobic ribonucleoside-triphosphate reductase activating protein